MNSDQNETSVTIPHEMESGAPVFYTENNDYQPYGRRTSVLVILSRVRCHDDLLCYVGDTNVMEARAYSSRCIIAGSYGYRLSKVTTYDARLFANILKKRAIRRAARLFA